MTNRQDQLLSQLTDLAAELSGYDTADLVPTHSFLELGFDSLFMTQLATSFTKEFGVPVTFRQLFDEVPSLAALAAYIDAGLPEEAAEAKPVVTPPPAAVEPPAAPEAAPQPLAQENTPQTAGIAAPTSGMAAVLAEQVKLMSEQLALLQQMRTGQVVTATTAPAAPAEPAHDTESLKTDSVILPQAKSEDKPEIKMPAGFGPDVTAGDRGDELTTRQRGGIRRLVERYNAKTAGSKRRTQEDRAVHADPRTAAGFNPLWKEMVYPLVVERSKGAYLWDVDGNQYIDILNGFGPNFFGHNAPFVTEALMAQLENSYEVGPQTPRAGEAARILCEMTGMDRVSWVNTGSEAVQAAIRISRTVTGRDKIVVFSGDYHGNFDEVLVRGTSGPKGRRTFPQAPGIPFDSVSNVIVLDYGEESALEAIRAQAGAIAAVLVEPVQSRRPELQPKEFLKELRALTEREGIVLVFDEVITGFRIRQGGAQEYFGIEADIATYGKIIGGGMPIGVVAGRAKFMDTFDGGMWQYGDASRPTAGVTFFAGTFVRHPLAITAAHASLNYLKNAGPSLQEGINRRATRMATALNTFFQEEGLNIEIPHFASQMFIRNREESELSTLLFYHMRDRGIHVLEGFPSYMTAAHTDEDVDEVVARIKDSVFEMQADGLLPSRNDGASARFVRRFDLTDDQRHIWLACQMGDEASCAFNESDTVVIDGALEEEPFRQAVTETLAAHEAFSLRFDEEGETQWVDENATFDLETHDFSMLGGDALDEALETYFAQKAGRVFDLVNGPLVNASLLKTDREQHIFAIYCHHIIFDGYSAHLVIGEIMARYKVLVSGEDAVLPEALPYSVYAYRKSSNSEKTRAGTQYWQETFADGLPTLADLPTDRPRDTERRYDGATLRHEIDDALAGKIRDTARSLKVSQNTLLMAAFSVLISRLSGSEDFVIGMPVAGQAGEEIETVGYCVNMLPLRVRLSGETAFADYASTLNRSVLEGFDNQNYSLTDLLQEIDPVRQPGRLPLTEVVFNYSRYFSDIDVPGLSVTTRENRREAVYYDLFFQVIEAQEEMAVYVDYSAALFEEATIKRWTTLYLDLLTDIAGDTSKALGALNLGRGGEAVLTGPQMVLGDNLTTLALIEERAAAAPDAVALTFNGESLTYGQVNEEASRLAHLLKARGIGASSIVGIMMDRGTDMVIAMLGVWKAGAAWLPLDPDYPAGRLALMVEDSGCQLVLTMSGLGQLAEEIPAETLALDAIRDELAALPAAAPESPPSEANRAYVLYTSGSTGRPKGVENSHGALVNFMKAMKDRPGLAAEDRLLAVTTISFDISILELFLPLTVGAEVVIAAREEAMDGYDLADLMEEHNITVMQATPVTWRLLLDCEWQGREGLKALCGGEALPPALAEDLLPYVGELWNMYGPTETTIWSTCELIDNPQAITVGAPIFNTDVHVLSGQGVPVPHGVPGNLWIGGTGVAMGYLGMPELTAERFIDNPFGDGRLYNTGDRAVVRGDGKLHILGRQDQQVKLRGHRIELGEVEAVLGSHEAVSQAAAAIRADHTGAPMLAAYLVAAADTEASHSDLRRHMRRLVPDYMIPQVFVELDALPLTGNNKIDRAALPDPEAGGAPAREAVPPRTAEEQMIAGLWREILDVEDVSVTDNFFELGGQSLQVVKMTARLKREHGLKLSPRAVIFETLEQLAASVTRKAG